MMRKCNPSGFIGSMVLGAVLLALSALNPALSSGRHIAMTPPDGDAGLCLAAIKVAESSRNLPKHLLHAIALTESGFWRQDSQTQVPWPWTVTVNGDGRYFESPHHAADYIKGLLRDGVTNIDVGCMQINLRYHGLAFDSIEEALSPVNNVAYAVSFLEDLRKRHNAWTKAIRFYHSGNWRRGSLYRARVQDKWTQLRQNEATLMAADADNTLQVNTFNFQQNEATVAAAVPSHGKSYDHLKLASWPPRSYSAQKRAETAAWTHAMKPLPTATKP